MAAPTARTAPPPRWRELRARRPEHQCGTSGDTVSAGRRELRDGLAVHARRNIPASSDDLHPPSSSRSTPPSLCHLASSACSRTCVCVETSVFITRRDPRALVLRDELQRRAALMIARWNNLRLGIAEVFATFCRRRRGANPVTVPDARRARMFSRTHCSRRGRCRACPRRQRGVTQGRGLAEVVVKPGR